MMPGCYWAIIRIGLISRERQTIHESDRDRKRRERQRATAKQDRAKQKVRRVEKPLFSILDSSEANFWWHTMFATP